MDDDRIINEWLISLNEDMKKQERKILLFLDNCTVHNNPPPLTNIELQFFPRNTTSKLQPLDQCIIKNCKTFYRQEVVKNVLECIESEQTPNISVLPAMIFVDKAWKKVAPSTILKCFKKLGFTIEIQETENGQSNIEPIQWNSLPTQENVPFTDYVNVNEDVAVWGSSL
ncbi:tigger transposable element-derived protein 6-like [Metopolophium dirhodum]|uniref:tigger transposable element-derived protein 6-like n=1 Tax=Metopolophium dirhodum TaxID=44670 RepID=UPI0029906252|nr:tigger transposable element-derived protein 6-like [Metopolophium dirhodum]